MEAPSSKITDHMQRLKSLHKSRHEARILNHKEVVAEDERLKLPANWETRQRQAEWLINDEKAKNAALEKGQDYDRVKLLKVSALESERIQKLKQKKKNSDPGFSDYEAQTTRQYNRLIKNLAPRNMVKYEEQKERLGEGFYGGNRVILQGKHKDTSVAVDNMVNDIEQQIAKRKKFSRRRTHNDDADIDYINEKNARFNKKLERYYGEHTVEIKQNLERGTAI